MKATVVLRAALTAHDIHPLLNEFPQYVFVISNPEDEPSLSEESLEAAEILVTGSLTDQELMMARRLRWIHSPTAYVEGLCMQAIRKQGNVLVTKSLSESAEQVGDFVMGAVLGFMKGLSHWKEATLARSSFEPELTSYEMKALRGSTMVQVGLGPAGGEIAERASHFGVRVLGVQEPPSFHHACRRVYSPGQLRTLLPHADIVCYCLPDRANLDEVFGSAELNLMRDGVVLIIICGARAVEPQELEFLAEHPQKYRGVFIDLHSAEGVPKQSRLWDIPQLIVSPGVAELPNLQKDQALRVFRRNLRQFTHANFGDMLYVEEGAFSNTLSS